MIIVRISGPSVMSFKSLLRNKYGCDVTAITTGYQRCVEKQARFRNHIIFSARCKRRGVVPPSLRVRSPINTDKGRSIARNAERQFLAERLRIANYRAKELEEERKWREIGLRRVLDPEDSERVLRVSAENAEVVFNKTREQQRKKFDRLVCRQIDCQRSGSDQAAKKTWVINLSSHELTSTERGVLEKGLNFAVTQRAVPRTEIIAGVETALRACKQINEEQAERARGAIAAVIRNAKPPEQNISPEDRLAISSLNQNEDIVVLPADKGNATVVMSTDEYEKKAHDLLDKDPFQKGKKDQTQRIEQRVNDTIKRLAKKKEEGSEQLLSLCVPNKGTRPPLFYGAVKVHKPNFPLRPIVSSIGSATYKVSRFISGILTEYTTQLSSYIRNTAHFLEDIQDVEIAEDEIMVSFDVKSLFTSIAREEAVAAVRTKLDMDQHLYARTGLTADTIVELLKLCMVTSFQFRDSYYELTDGLAMGAPSSPAIANVYMGTLEERALSTFRQPPKFWRRYVDDVFSILRKVELNDFLQHLNSQHPSIVFTVETEMDGSLPFLDVRVHRNGNKLVTTVYRKPTHTGRYLHYLSNHPDTAKRSVVRALTNRKEYITAGEGEIKQELARVDDELSMNDYPRNFVERCRRKDRWSSRQPRTVPKATATVPYIKGVSEAIGRILAPLDIRTVSRPLPLKWQLMGGVKDKISASREPGTIYAIGCQECKKVYIGETARTAEQRSKEHKAHARYGRTEQSAVANHFVTEGHAIHWEPHIVGREKNTVKRKVKEAMIIKRLQRRDGLMNADSGLQLSKLWLDLA